MRFQRLPATHRLIRPSLVAALWCFAVLSGSGGAGVVGHSGAPKSLPGRGATLFSYQALALSAIHGHERVGIQYR